MDPPENSVPEENVPETVVPEELTKLSPPADESSAFVQSTEDPQVETVKESPTPRRPGRPKGSKDAKPRTTKKTKIVSVSTENESPALAQNTIQETPPELPRALPNSHPIPITAYDNRSRMMLDMLARQSHDRKTRKSDLWKSWFQ